MIGDLTTASAIKSLEEVRRDCSLNKCYKAFSTDRLVQKQKVKGQRFPLEKYPSQPSSYYCLLSQHAPQKPGRSLGEATVTKTTVINQYSSTSRTQDDKAIQRAVLCTERKVFGSCFNCILVPFTNEHTQVDLLRKQALGLCQLMKQLIEKIRIILNAS